LAPTVGVENPYRYRGYRYDSETGLYYLQSRYYNTEIQNGINKELKILAEGAIKIFK
jgi:RHS repeat-associated protein